MQRYWNRFAWLHTQPLEGFGLQRCRLGDDCEGVVWLAGQGGFIAGQVAEMLEHGAQAVGGQAGFGALGCGLPLCPLGYFGLLHLCLSLGGCTLGVVVLEQHWRQALAQVSFEIVSEHAQEDMSADMVGAADRPDLELALPHRPTRTVRAPFGDRTPLGDRCVKYTFFQAEPGFIDYFSLVNIGPTRMLI